MLRTGQDGVPRNGTSLKYLPRVVYDLDPSGIVRLFISHLLRLKTRPNYKIDGPCVLRRIRHTSRRLYHALYITTPVSYKYEALIICSVKYMSCLYVLEATRFVPIVFETTKII